MNEFIKELKEKTENLNAGGDYLKTFVNEFIELIIEFRDVDFDRALAKKANIIGYLCALSDMKLITVELRDDLSNLCFDMIVQAMRDLD